MVAALITVACLAAACDTDNGTERDRLDVDSVARACRLDDEILVRLWRGHDRIGSEDVTMVPREPNFIGSFNLVSHSGPWDYLQRIPLVLYGPGYIKASREPTTAPANIVDVYPTIDKLLGIDLPERDGRPLRDALVGSPRPPKLILVIVWDGAGRATLEEWPDRWPVLARLERQGTSYLNATVGTSPSVTTAVHASLATGAWPRSHKVTGNEIRQTDGTIDIAFAGNSGDSLALTTFADETDRSYQNESIVGALGWTQWHVGMLGRGTAVAGGDADELGLIEYRNGIEVLGNDDYFSTPTYLGNDPSIEERVAELDRRDGTVDGKWRGHDISLEQATTWLSYGNPAWAAFQADLIEEMIDTRGYGDDATPDVLLSNFKMTDLAGHRWALDSEETADVLTAQDAALGEIVEYLDSTVDDYVMVVTADHGTSRSPLSSGAWPIDQRRLIEDVEARFGGGERSLVEDSSAFGLYLERDSMKATGTTPEDVAAFLNSYTIRDNWSNDPLPEGYEARGDELVFSAAYAKSQVDAVMRCAFGSTAPPRKARA